MSGATILRVCQWLAIPVGIYLAGVAAPHSGGNNLAAGLVGGGAALVLVFMVRGMVESARLRREGVPPSRWD